MPLSRRAFLHRLTVGAAALASPVALLADDHPALDCERVFAFVKAGHNDLAAVTSMLSEEPLLLNAAWDWGGGDFETALGGAGHVGNAAIARYLIDRGARADLFALTMLGETDLVIPMLERFPTLLDAPGPHGFTLLHHARVGGDAAAPLVDYRAGKGLTEGKRPLPGRD